MHSATSKVEEQVYWLTNKPPARIAQPLSQALTAPIATWLKTTLRKCAGLSKTSSKKILRRSTQNPTGIHPQSMQTMSNSSQRTHPHPTCLTMTTTSSTLSVFAHHHGNNSTKDDMYFTWLLASISPNKTIKVSLQVDSAATCNTLPSPIDRKISESAPLQPSHAKIFPHSGKAIYSVGKVSLACEGASHFETLKVQVMDSKGIPEKPALTSSKDSERLGLTKFHQDRVFSSTTSDIKPKQNHVHMASSGKICFLSGGGLGNFGIFFPKIVLALLAF